MCLKKARIKDLVIFYFFKKKKTILNSFKKVLKKTQKQTNKDFNGNIQKIINDFLKIEQ